MPEAGGGAHTAPASELEAIPVLSANLVARSANRRAIDASSDVLCRKGTATTSRWRSYDHKEVFEPAEGATAPPSDADELGSWLKYEGSRPAPANRTEAVNDEELPTSWYKYEAKPAASLLGPTEKPRHKAPIQLPETAPAAVLEQPDAPEPSAGLNSSEVQAEPRLVEPVPDGEARPIPLEPPISEIGAASACSKTDAPRPEMLASGAASTPDLRDEPESCAAEPPTASAEPAHPTFEIVQSPMEPPPIDVPEKLDTEADAPIDFSPIPREITVAPVVDSEEPGVDASVQAPATSIPVDEVPRGETATEPVIAVPAAVQGSEPPTAQVLDIGPSGAEPAAEPIADVATSLIEPNEPPPIPVAPITTRSPETKAMLARLADMLERALSAKRTTGTPEALRAAAEPERPAPATLVREATGVEAPAPPAPVSMREETQASAGVTATAERENAVEIAAPPEAIEHVDLRPTEGAAVADSAPVTPEQETPFVARPSDATILERTPEPQSAAVEIVPAHEDPDEVSDTSYATLILSDALVDAPSRDAIDAALEAPCEMASASPDDAATHEVTSAEPQPELRAEPLTPEPLNPEAPRAAPEPEPSAPVALIEERTDVAAPAPPVPVSTGEETQASAGVTDTAEQENAVEIAAPPEAIGHVDLESGIAAQAASTPVEVRLSPILGLDPVLPAGPAEVDDLREWLPSTEDAAVAGPAPGTPDQEARFVTRPSDATIPERTPEPQSAAAEIVPAHEDPAEVSDTSRATFILFDAPVDAPSRDGIDPALGAPDGMAAVPPGSSCLETIETSPPTLDVVASPDDAAMDEAALAEPPPELRAEPVTPESLIRATLTESMASPADSASRQLAEAYVVPIWEPPVEVLQALADKTAAPPVSVEHEATTVADILAPPAEAPISSPGPVSAVPEPSSVESSDATTEPVAETSVPENHTASVATEAAAVPADPSAESPLEPAGPIEAPAITAVVPVEPTPTPADAIPASAIDPQKAAREALASGLADMIHDVLSTTQFASKALKPVRYSPALSAGDEPETPEPTEGGEPSAAAVPEPVAIRSRLGRVERALAFASVGMMIVVGYFAFSLWRDQGVVAAPVPAIAAVAPSPGAWAERPRDATRELGAAAVDALTTPSGIHGTGVPKAADARRARP